jgi:hypothetical protein
MFDELLTNPIGGGGEIHITGPGGDRLLWVEWTDCLIRQRYSAPGHRERPRMKRQLPRLPRTSD